jgi:hypothetical protein
MEFHNRVRALSNSWNTFYPVSFKRGDGSIDQSDAELGSHFKH